MLIFQQRLKAKSQGLGRISFYGDGGWETGREFDYYNATVLKDVPGGSKEIEISNISFVSREGTGYQHTKG